MGEPLRILARRPLCSPGFTRKFLADYGISERFSPEQILYLTPNKRKARTAEFEILSHYRGLGVSRQPACLTLQTFAEKIVASSLDKGIVDERDRRFIMLRLIGEYEEGLFKQEHVGLLSELYSELKRYYPEGWQQIPQIASEVTFDSDTSSRLRAAIELIGLYEEYLAEQNLLDHEMLLDAATSSVLSLPYELIIIEGYFEPWVSEQRLFKALINQIPEIVVVIPDDPIAKKGREFFSSFNLVELEVPEASPPPQIAWHRFPSREDEVVALARQICALARNGKVRPNEIVVVFPALNTYRPIVERVFARYGIETDCSLRPGLDEHPGIQKVLDLMRTAEQGFRRRDVIGILISPVFKDVPKAVRRWLDIISREEGIVSGENQWLDWLGPGASRALKDKEQSEKLSSEIREFMGRFVSDLKGLSTISSVKDVIVKLRSILDFLGWSVSEEIVKGFNETCEKLLRISELAKEAKLNPRFIRETLEVLFKKETPELHKEKKNSIRVIPVVESRWLDANHLFVGGLVDGEFPLHSKRDLLLPERLRAKLGLAGAEEEFANANFEFRRLELMGRDRVYLSAPIMEGDRPFLISVFLEEREEIPLKTEDAIYCLEEKQLLEPQESLNPGEGVVFEDENSLKLLNTNLGSRYPFRVTLLETYKGCPFRYYLGTVLGIEPVEEPTQEPEARLLGIIMHEVLETLFKSDSDPEHLGERLRDTLSLVLDRFRLNPFLRLWVEEWVAARADWLKEVESARKDGGWLVNPNWLEHDLQYYFPEEQISLKGRVDRVDWKDNRARVIDYKTGKEKAFILRMEKGESFQLPLYCEMIKRRHRAQVASFSMYGFQDTEIEEYDNPEPVMLSAVDIASGIVRAIRRGEFPSNKTQTCRFCEFNEFC